MPDNGGLQSLVVTITLYSTNTHSQNAMKHPEAFALPACPEWQILSSQAQQLQTLRVLCADPQRFAQHSIEADGMLLDFSKQRVNPAIMANLHALWHRADVPTWIQKMRDGEPINTSEQRSVLHTALREPHPRPEVKTVLDKMAHFCSAVHQKHWRGGTGEVIRDVVNIGIGGSDLGAKMAVTALSAFQVSDLRVHFVSNLDATHLASTLSHLNPRTTLFIVVSKTFTTQETMRNALSARQWIFNALGKAAVAQHFVAVSSNLAEATRFGIQTEQIFEFWDWVGGRFSLWSAVGLSIALAIGFENFSRLLAGAHAMDQHFFSAPVTKNLPATLALLDLWNTNFLKAESRAVLPYSQSLAHLPSYLEQLEMESNGKQVRRDGRPVCCETAPLVWGEAGTNGQHAFYQLLHQGGRLIPCEFIAYRTPDFHLPGHHAALLAHCFAQSEALMRGKTQAEAQQELCNSGLDATNIEHLAPFKTFPGNQPSTTLLLSHLDPFTLGQLVALYEHKTFVLGVLWGLNSFDQWGVEYGKQLAGRLLPLVEQALKGEALAADAINDSSTRGLIHWLRQQ